MIDRRRLIAGGAMLAATGGTWRRALSAEVDLPFANGQRPLVQYPQKRPLIRLTERPPQLETPFAVFDEGVLTPNDAFFVRYHLADIPLSIDPETYRLEIGGKVARPLSLSLADLKKRPTVDLVAVNQCSGNSRGLFEPRVAGGQLGNGAMGNARWRGVPLKPILDEAGVLPGAQQVIFDGLDGPVDPATPDFIKALGIDHARDGEVMLAWGMNGADLPWLNGYPLRLIVPGYYGTYWVKHLNKITVTDQEFDGFWMKTAYRIPDNECACVAPGGKPDKTVPIGRFDVRSFVTNLTEGTKIHAGVQTLIRGIAFDGGTGIQDVALSTDGGTSWSETRLGQDLGPYSFRPWSAMVTLAAGSHDIRVRAASRGGEVQPLTPLWNPAGYRRNVVESIRVQAV